MDHHRGFYSHCLHIEQAEKQRAEKGRVVLDIVSGVAEVEKVEGEIGEAGTLDVTLSKYIRTVFYQLCCFFSSLKMFPHGINCSSTTCFRFSAHIIERSKS